MWNTILLAKNACFQLMGFNSSYWILYSSAYRHWQFPTL